MPSAALKAVPRVSRPVAIVLALRAKEEAIQPFVLPHRVEALPPTGEKLVHVALVRNVENEFVLRRVEDPVQGDRQLYHAEIRPEMAADRLWVFLREHPDEFIPNFFGELR
jgi:hypothetical protein